MPMQPAIARQNGKASLSTTGPPRKQPLLCLLPPPLSSSWAHYSTQVSDCCDSGQNKTHTFSKSIFLPTIIEPCTGPSPALARDAQALVRPVSDSLSELPARVRPEPVFDLSLLPKQLILYYFSN